MNRTKSEQRVTTATEAVKSLLRGMRLPDVAQKYAVDAKTLRQWQEAFVSGGTTALERTLLSPGQRYHFISYARKDKQIAKVVFRELYSSGVNIWVDTHDIPGGSAWPETIDDAIRGADKMILMLSPHSVGSREVWREVRLGLEYGKTIIPTKLRPVQLPTKFEKAIGELEVISLTEYRQERTGLIIDALNEVASARVPRQQEMMFRHNMRFVSETLKYIQDISQNGGNLIISTVSDDTEQSYYVQFAAMSADSHVRAEAVGNANLPAKTALEESQQQQLLDMGWLKPDSNSFGNYWREFHCQTDSDRRTVANFAIRTMLFVYHHLPGEYVIPEIQFHG